MRCDDASGSSGTAARRPGFTLLEVLIVMAISAIVMGIAVAPMQATARAARLENARQALIGDLRLARVEAIRRNRSVDVTLVSDSTYTIEYIGSRSLKDGVTFASGTAALRFAPFGPVMTGMGSYVLELEGESSTVAVSAAGNASAQ